MKKLTICILLILSCILTDQTFSQPSLEWAYNFGSFGHFIEVDTNDDIIAAGWDSPLTAGIITMKYNPSGSRLWVSRPSSLDFAFPTSMILDNSNNIYQTALYNNQGYDVVTIKYNTEGTIKWSRSFDNPQFAGSDDSALSIAVDNSGNVFVSGYVTMSSSGKDFVTIKYDSTGLLQWYRIFGENGTDMAFSNSVDNNGNVYVTGKSFRSGQGYDVVTIKYAPNGNVVWQVRFNGTLNADDIPAKIVWNDNYLFISGLGYDSDSTRGYLFLKYDSNGILRWSSSYGETSPAKLTSMLVNNDHDIFATGSPFTVALDSSGVFIWAAPQSGIMNDMAFDNSENIYVTGNQSFGSTIITKFNKNGTLNWSALQNRGCSFNCQNYFSNSIAINSSNNVYTNGYEYCECGSMMKSMRTSKYGTTYDLQSIIYLFIQGFYRNALNTTIEDIVNVDLRSPVSPYDIIYSSEGIVHENGDANFTFDNYSQGSYYYIIVTHRNSIETWSKNPVDIEGGYSFTESGLAAYGNNLVQIDDTPLRFGIFSGDVIRDGSVDVADLISVYNVSSIFPQGYVVQDVTGDNFVDISDVILVYNNSSTFVQSITP